MQVNMRITVHVESDTITLKVEGSLAGPQVPVLEECWQSTLASVRRPTLCVDLTGVTFIDDAGQASLAAMHRAGAEFIAADALTKEIVTEITQGPLPDHERPKGKVPSDRRAQTKNDTWI
jgi:ABC-type transporter Mla MlaB component